MEALRHELSDIQEQLRSCTNGPDRAKLTKKRKQIKIKIQQLQKLNNMDQSRDFQIEVTENSPEEESQRYVIDKIWSPRAEKFQEYKHFTSPYIAFRNKKV